MDNTIITRRRIVAGAGAGLAAVVGLGRFGSAQDATPGAGTPAASPAASPVASPVVAASPAAEAGGSEVAVTLLDFKFEPRELSFPADTDVSVVVTNGGVSVHNYWLDDLDLGTELVNPGTSVSLALNLPAGEYRVICTVPGHVELGMVGKLIVG